VSPKIKTVAHGFTNSNQAQTFSTNRVKRGRNQAATTQWLKPTTQATIQYSNYKINATTSTGKGTDWHYRATEGSKGTGARASLHWYRTVPVYQSTEGKNVLVPVWYRNTTSHQQPNETQASTSKALVSVRVATGNKEPRRTIKQNQSKQYQNRGQPSQGYPNSIQK
jgi:hypothetical protein